VKGVKGVKGAKCVRRQAKGVSCLSVSCCCWCCCCCCWGYYNNSIGLLSIQLSALVRAKQLLLVVLP